ncbi:Nucleoside-diphosphate-sugar epimerase [Actinacidiphila alni]|uniref:Nucleoside-diphosphate-sugar epimerase n=1 Tax=Actinacidiphila alni TaxID=380248 RepID=A0A1I2JCB7_9ACTN|nr:NAD(P)-dependent oxidoreductase [Actinacidiphila alni]SFF52174.1 Nucleoside-diphosphate-sugar epimerase [Actinacidiphila alni]
MRIVVAGATGVVGRQIVPMLSAAGHEVVALSRRPGPGTGSIRTVAVDALDREALGDAVREARPDAVVHLLTAIPGDINPRRMERDFALTNRLRTEATRTLAEAARDAGGARLIAQGLAYAYEPSYGQGALAAESDPFWEHPPKEWATSLAALEELERLTAAADGLVLRFGHLYGPGTAYAADGATARQILAGKMPVVGDGGATFSFVHTFDAASAVLAALARPEVTGALNVVDEDPATVGDWLPATAALLGAPAPKHVPTALARLAAGAWGVAFMTRLRGATNARARKVLGWTPAHPSWRTGLVTG